MPPAWAPTVAQVGAILFARTRDNNGVEVGTFNANTRPTDAQVTPLIASAADDVADAVGENIPADLYENAGQVAALGAAMQVEFGFYPEQVNSGRSTFPQLEKQYEARLQRLRDAVEFEGGETPGDEYMHPAGAFGGNPLPIRWWTQW